jgi:spermidine/putrescine transport system ATP-binding protein
VRPVANRGPLPLSFVADFGMENDREVELIDVTKRFGAATAVDSVSLNVRSSEFLTLLGPSGCGKTTLLRMIGGFTSPDQGRVLLAGEDVTSLPPYRRNVCTVFQQYALFPHMTVAENVAFGLERRRRPRAEIKQRVDDSLQMVRLTGLELRRPSELSGGQQQRVALARAIVLQPRVLLLDEPLAALDLKLRKQMQIELKSLQRRLGISFIYVTHDQEEALTMSDRIAVLNGGHIEQIGQAADVYERPATEFVADFIGLSNIFEGKVADIEGGAMVVDFGASRIRINNPERKTQGPASGKVRFMVRPEKIMLYPTERHGLISGTIEAAVYLGESTRWHIRLSGGQEIQVLEQNTGHAAAQELAVGKHVSVGWAPESAVIL